MVSIGQRLKDLRGSKSQREIADAIEGLTREKLSHYETGRSQPDLEMQNKLADFFKVTIDFLAGRTDNPHLFKAQSEPPQSEGFDVYADPEGWIELLAAEYEEKNGRPFPDWKKKAILELLETDRDKNQQ